MANAKDVLLWRVENGELSALKPLTTMDNVAGLEEALTDKVDKVSGKQLSTNDFTGAYRAKLDATNVAYGTCSTAATTAAKVINLSSNGNWALTAGSRITVKFSATNTASNPTFNVNGTGAKSVWYNTAVITTASLSYAGYANRPMDFVYDGTQYVFTGWSVDSNSTYSNASLGQGYGTCSTAASTTAKVVSLSSYALTKGGIVAVKFTNAVPASATMNINSKGAKAIFYRGAAITANVIKAGDLATFIYDGTQYHLLTVDRDNNTTYSVATQSAAGLMSAADKQKLDGLTSGTGGATSNRLYDDYMGAELLLTNNGLDSVLRYSEMANNVSVDITVSDLTKMKAAAERAVENFSYSGYPIPTVYFNGDITAMNKETAVTLSYVYGERSGTCTLKWQGNSSLEFPKKNYTVKFDNAFEAREGWGEQKKYCLKADWVDFSHCRNVVSAKLWGDIVRSRAESDLVTRLSALPNCGAIDGFPCFVVINGEWKGVYNFNIPKDSWMMGMGSGTKEAILCAEQWSDPTLFRAEAALSTNFEVEYKSDTFSNSEILTSLNRLINAVRNSAGTDIDTTIAQYVDIDSAIDYLIFAQLLHHKDGIGKNYILATYDGTKWFFSAYDLDLVFGNNSLAGIFDSAEENDTILSHKLFALLWTYKFEEIYTRYKEIVGNTMSQATVDSKFNNYCVSIPLAAYNADAELWKYIPCTSVSNIAQIITWYGERLNYMEKRYKCGTKGLSYGIRDDFTCKCLGMGTCVEPNIEIASSAYNRETQLIGENAFKGETILENIVIPEPVNTIQNTAFHNCTSLKKVVLPKTLLSFSYGAFVGCTALKSIELPDSLVNVGASNFQGCTNLVKVSMAKNFPKIQNRLFYGCTALKDIFYGGTMADWEVIEKGTEWDANTGEYTIHCSDGDISKV